MVVCGYLNEELGRKIVKDFNTWHQFLSINVCVNRFKELKSLMS